MWSGSEVLIPVVGRCVRRSGQGEELIPLPLSPTLRWAGQGAGQFQCLRTGHSCPQALPFLSGHVQLGDCWAWCRGVGTQTNAISLVSQAQSPLPTSFDTSTRTFGHLVTCSQQYSLLDCCSGFLWAAGWCWPCWRATEWAWARTDGRVPHQPAGSCVCMGISESTSSPS